MLGLLVQIRPFMGFDLLLPLFAAAILGGIGSVPGAFAGALIIGLGEAMTVQLAGSEWRAAVAFLVLIAVLIVRPTGLAGSAVVTLDLIGPIAYAGFFLSWRSSTRSSVSGSTCNGGRQACSMWVSPASLPSAPMSRRS